MSFRLALLPAGLAAVAVTIVVAAAAVPLVTPVRVQIVTSGSMAPSIPVGAVVLTVPLDRVAAPGDVILFPQPLGRATVVHRVVAVEAGAKENAYATKGDANDTDDGWRISAGAVNGRVAAVVPFAGYALGTLQRPAARIGIGLLVLALILPTLRSVARRPPAAVALPSLRSPTRRSAATSLASASSIGTPEAQDHLAAWLAQLRRAEAGRGLDRRLAP